MSLLGGTLALTVLGVGRINLWLGLGAARLGLGLPAAPSLAGAITGLLAVREFWHG